MSNSGKCAEEFKLRLFFSAAEIIVRRACEIEMSTGEYFRTILEVRAHGKSLSLKVTGKEA